MKFFSVAVALAMLALMLVVAGCGPKGDKKGDKQTTVAHDANQVSTHVICLVCDKNPVDMSKPPAYSVTPQTPAGLALCSQACADKYKANPSAYVKGSPAYFQRMAAEHSKPTGPAPKK